MRLKYLFSVFLLTACTIVKAPEKPDQKVEYPEQTTIKEDVVVSFVAVGDNLIHGAVYHDARTSNGGYDFKPMYQYIKPYIQTADVAFLNQETILGGSSLGLSHYPQFNSPAEVAEAVADTGFNVINHATNHSYDKREQGIINTLATWDQYSDIIVAGINRSQEERDSIRILDASGIRIGFLAYAEHTNGIPLPSDKSYLVNIFSEDIIKNDVLKAKAQTDFLMVSMHWGNEDSFQPNTVQKEYANMLCELGVDVVIGTHPHVIQPVELIKCNNHTMLMMYSLGNFLSAQDFSYNMIEGMMTWQVRFDGKTKSPSFEQIEFVPLINHFDAGFTNFRVYPWADYPKDQWTKHGLHGYKNQLMNPTKLEAKIREVVGDEISIRFE